ncbi:hypothetical protein FAM09_13085 [Niastella caeni]|uniref:Cytochrome c domain-containing protein n=1 Tax=Niastella caeni TaxID=2569763 RepID=A0A4S8HZ42_9BACT|nr:hypothetical protein [Niastella caeni]THU39434.1 hypothetical protein FAM09_13085 [Niastella caeni]
MNRIITIVVLLLSAIVAAAYLPYSHPGAVRGNEGSVLLPQISGYKIFVGDPVALTPGNGFHLYELATSLFTDHAEKQRLIKVPAGSRITAANDGLPQYPDGAILVKTFYYFNDKRNVSAGKRLIETRVLIKNNGQWLAGTYVWNATQTDAILVAGGSKTSVNWIDEKGNRKAISYRIPSAKDCATCHNANNAIIPIGMKVRNLNIEVDRNNRSINQLQHLQNAGIMDPVNPDQFSKLPAWQNRTYSISERVRAYLDVNCAHCHSDAGSCARSAVRFAWEIPVENTRITARKNRIISLMSTGRMPRIGTTMVDEEALTLIKKYLQSQ